ncbi:MAG: PQQ-binding-like beta-propeller repeat protein [Chitinophagaceae bacterium]|nr:PQQ-binding-like beta-propeller repeat protein [Chitinophagaceae bacterium]
MKKLMLLLFLCFSLAGNSQFMPFRFAFITDTHIGSPGGTSEEDLRRTVRDINAMKDIVFVVVTGDVTELGTNEEIKLAKQILDSLNVRWYIFPGNHDTGWSESGGVTFTNVFGSDKFSFEYNGILFLGCASGPYVRMSDGHVPRDAVNWLEKEIKKMKPGQPLIFLNHYPLDEGLDNWYEVTDRLHRRNTWIALCGHGHANKLMSFEDIPAVMGCSNLRAKTEEKGYNLVDVRPDSILFTERRPLSGKEKKWTGVKVETRSYDLTRQFPRPDYSVNTSYSNVKEIWTYSSDANIISTPAVSADKVFVGNQKGVMYGFSIATGKVLWKHKTEGAIFSSPVVAEEKLVFGSGDGYVYCLSAKRGKLLWKYKASASVLGSPVINGDTIFVGGSDHSFVALNVANGNIIWKYTGLQGPVVSTPLVYEGKVIFGAWDRHLYAVSCASGELLWKWNNGSSVRNYSPAACTPVAADGVVYVVAPDRYISAIEAATGKTLWRNNDATVRESIGISEDGKWVYGKTMQDTIVAYAVSKQKQTAVWKLHAGFGYEHVPSMLIEKEGLLYFGTKSGVVYCINPALRSIAWVHKIDNSMVNTVRVLTNRRLLVSTMDGKLVLLQAN